MTGIGGFLQEFLYGYSGLRFEAGDVRLAPSLTASSAAWCCTTSPGAAACSPISVGRTRTTVTLTQRRPAAADDPRRRRARSSPVRRLRIPTAGPTSTPTADAVRCQRGHGDQREPGAPALAAVDGSPPPTGSRCRLPATLTDAASGAGHRTISRVTVVWGRQWPRAVHTQHPPPPRPVRTLRPARLRAAGVGQRPALAHRGVGARAPLADDRRLRLRRACAPATCGSDHQGHRDRQSRETINNKKVKVKAMPMLEELTATR